MTQTKVAFVLADEELSGGTVSYGDGKTLDVLQAIEDGGGTIVVDVDSPEQVALDAFPGVKRTSVPEDAQTDDNAAKPSKAAAEKAARLGVDLSQVEGTGANGQITVGDVERAAEGSES